MGRLFGSDRPAGATGERTHEDAVTATLYAPTTQRVRRAPTVVDFVNIRWVDDWCKRCNICIEICPKDSLVLTHDAIVEVENCIRCGLCERYCPDLAIEVIPAQAVATLQAAGAATTGARPHPRVPQRSGTPDTARGPAVAGTDPNRGITDVESAPDVDRANPT
ncbi:MAG: 4Fe-4S binding protein [Chloroflexi bacterium]|nr:4Fe-4S binding protein [Chloroflexota bacterium]